MQGRVQRSISSQAYSKLSSSNQLQINIQQPIARGNFSQMSSSIHQHQNSELSIHDKINMLNQSIRTSQKNQRLFQDNRLLREKLHQTEEALQDAMIKCSLWDKFKITIEGLNKDYLQLKSIENNCSDGTILKEFLSVLRDKLEKVAISERVEKNYSVQSKKKDTEYYELYEKEKKHNFEYEQHIITLNNQLDMLEEENQKLREKIKSSSLQSSGVIGSDGTLLTGADKKLFEEYNLLKEQNVYLLEHKDTIQQQLDAQRLKLNEIVESLDQYESELKKNELQLKKRNQQLQNQAEMAKDQEKTIKIQLEQAIEENNSLRSECQRLKGLLKSIQQSQNVQFSNLSNQNSHLNVQQSQQYLELMTQYEILYQKYQKVKAQNEVLGQEKQKLGQQMQQIQHLSKQMQYNYEVKIDDLRKLYEGEIETIKNKYNQKILSLSEERSQTIKEAEKEKNTLTQKLQILQRSTCSQDSDKEQLTIKYEQLTVKYDRTVADSKEQIAQCNKLIEQHEMIIQELKEQIYSLTEELQNSKRQMNEAKCTHNSNEPNDSEIEERYKQKVQSLQIELEKSYQKNKQLEQEVASLREHIETNTAQLNEQDEIIEQFKQELISKDQLIEKFNQDIVGKNQLLEQIKQQLTNKDQLIMKISNQQFSTIQFHQSQENSQSDHTLRKSSNIQQTNSQNIQHQSQIQYLQHQVQSLTDANEQFRKAFSQQEDNNSILKRNITEWQSKYTQLYQQNKSLALENQSFIHQLQTLKTQNNSLRNIISQLNTLNQSLKQELQTHSKTLVQNQSLQLKIAQLTQQIFNLNSQLQQLKTQNALSAHQLTIKKTPSIHTQSTNYVESSEINSPNYMQNMDGLMVEALKEQIDNLLQQNRTIEEENNRYRQEISQSQEQVHEIQRYVKLISVQNKKIPHYQQELANQRLKSSKLKHKLMQQKQKFVTIMQKNQTVYEQLVKKSERNELLLNQNIRIQKQETYKLQTLINKYYSTFIPESQHTQKKNQLSDQQPNQ